MVGEGEVIRESGEVRRKERKLEDWKSRQVVRGGEAGR